MCRAAGAGMAARRRGLFGYLALYVAALGLAPVAGANLLDYTWPLLIVMLSSVLLCLAGFAPLTPMLLLAAGFVAVGEVVAARG